jgi:AGCS family alanine or glycine:cation symporter
MNIATTLNKYIANFASWIWDWPLLLVVLGGGFFLLIYSRFTPFYYFTHAIAILRGKYDHQSEKGQLTHFQALSSALAATVGMGNISGVAIAIVTGGPGAIFWMWITALVGMATKFYTSSLAVMYREEDGKGGYLAGPMYVIMKGLGKKWKPLAVFFASVGLLGTMPAFQANQLTEVMLNIGGLQAHENLVYIKLAIGLAIAAITSMVIFGGIKRIGLLASRLVPFMVLLYFATVFVIIFLNYEQVPTLLKLIFTDAFSGNAVLGGLLGTLIKTGVKRAAFSNEAGTGTAPMMHGTAKTNEPIREGLVAMVGPFIDTIVVCTLTALAILLTDTWHTTSANGISITLNAFSSALPLYNIGKGILVVAVFIFAFSTLFSYSHYGKTCLGFLTHPKYGKYYNYFYIISIIVAAVVKLEFVINLIDGMFALMAIPTIISALLLAPKVNQAAKVYFGKLK